MPDRVGGGRPHFRPYLRRRHRSRRVTVHTSRLRDQYKQGTPRAVAPSPRSPGGSIQRHRRGGCAMKRMPDTAIKECVTELRAACRLPIEEAALEKLVGWLRPNFERILGHPDGPKRWADHGQRMRDNARHLGGFADFFASHAEARSIDAEALQRAFQ